MPPNPNDSRPVDTFVYVFVAPNESSVGSCSRLICMLTGMGGMDVLLSPQDTSISAKTRTLARRVNMKNLKRMRNRLNRWVDNVAKVEIIFSFPMEGRIKMRRRIAPAFPSCSLWGRFCELISRPIGFPDSSIYYRHRQRLLHKEC